MSTSGTSQQCALCELPAVSRCSGCKNIWFCSELCQKTLWPVHKTLCGGDQKYFRQAPLTNKELRDLETVKDSDACQGDCGHDHGKTFHAAFTLLAKPLWAIHKPLCGAATEVFQQAPIFPFKLKAYSMNEEVKASFLEHVREQIVVEGPPLTWEDITDMLEYPAVPSDEVDDAIPWIRHNMIQFVRLCVRRCLTSANAPADFAIEPKPWSTVSDLDYSLGEWRQGPKPPKLSTSSRGVLNAFWRQIVILVHVYEQARVAHLDMSDLHEPVEWIRIAKKRALGALDRSTAPDEIKSQMRERVNADWKDAEILEELSKHCKQPTLGRHFVLVV